MTREQHQVLPEIQQQLTLAGGLNRYGQPNFRAVWGGSRLAWIGGEWTDRDASGNEIGKSFELRYVPKALPQFWDRWIIESYQPPEFYGSRWLWYFQTRKKDENSARTLPGLGPYPERGDYEQSEVVEKACAKCIKAYREGDPKAIQNCTDWEFVQLTPFVANKIARMILLSREVTHEEQKKAIEDQIRREMALEDMAADEIIESAQSYQIPKSRQEYIERCLVPALDRKIARDLNRRKTLSPETMRILDRGRSAAMPN